MKKLLLVLCLALTTVLVLPNVASASTPTLKQLAKTVASLQKQVTTLKSQLAHAKSVLALAPYVSVTQTAINGVKGPNLVFKGCNLQIKSPTGQTDTSGLGNLIVGWDDSPPSMPSGYRTGSNNLVCGDLNGFTSHGGFVAGGANNVTGLSTSVCGGSGNTASGYQTSVSGGENNVASDYHASVSGGLNNSATGYDALVSGGYGNTASGTEASVSGGNGITASATYGWGHP
jgi:hypothetical protein